MVAVSLCLTVSPRVQLLAKGELPEPYALGLAQARWAGRAQTVADSDSSAPEGESCSNLTFHLDGAHTGESAATCAEWFAGAAQADEAAQSAPSERVLVFNCMKVRYLLLAPFRAQRLTSYTLLFRSASRNGFCSR